MSQEETYEFEAPQYTDFNVPKYQKKKRALESIINGDSEAEYDDSFNQRYFFIQAIFLFYLMLLHFSFNSANTDMSEWFNHSHEAHESNEVVIPESLLEDSILDSPKTPKVSKVIASQNVTPKLRRVESIKTPSKVKVAETPFKKLNKLILKSKRFKPYSLEEDDQELKSIQNPESDQDIDLLEKISAYNNRLEVKKAFGDDDILDQIEQFNSKFAQKAEPDTKDDPPIKIAVPDTTKNNRKIVIDMGEKLKAQKKKRIPAIPTKKIVTTEVKPRRRMASTFTPRLNSTTHKENAEIDDIKALLDQHNNKIRPRRKT